MEKILYICRGISGSGKSTFAKTLGCPVYEADQYFMVHRDFETNEIIGRNQTNGVYSITFSFSNDDNAITGTYTGAMNVLNYQY
jgi:adenylate kinase family enzyme